MCHQRIKTVVCRIVAVKLSIRPLPNFENVGIVEIAKKIHSESREPSAVFAVVFTSHVLLSDNIRNCCIYCILECVAFCETCHSIFLWATIGINTLEQACTICDLIRIITEIMRFIQTQISFQTCD